jgi:Septum formation initiator
LSAVVLATSLPVSALLTQRHAISSTAARQAKLHTEDSALSREVANLNDPSAIADVARSDYGFVHPGDKAYTVLPAPGSSASAAALSGHVPLNGPPVVPGSRTSQELLGAGSVPVTGSTSSATTSPSARARASTSASPHGSSGGASSSEGAPSSGSFLTRVRETLEFWR